MKVNLRAALISVAFLSGSIVPGAVYSGNLLKANGVSTEADAISYYQTIDPNNERLTQDAWRAVNGFDDPRNEIVVVGGHQNVSDLGFWRRIEMVIDKRPGFVGNVAMTTFNFETEDDAFLNLNAKSIVNMEYSPGPNGDRITKFSIYDAGSGDRKNSTFFDPNPATREELFLPNACAACHGGGTHGVDFRTHGGKTGGGWLAFDFNVFHYGSRTSRAANEAGVKKLNQGVRMTYPPSAVETLISGLYGGNNLPLATQDSAYRPKSWNTEPALWNVVVTDCLGCHTLTEQDVLSLDQWKRNVGSFREITFIKKEMPNAPFSNRRFFNTNNHQIVENALNRFRP
jgi:hypothetical protein